MEHIRYRLQITGGALSGVFLLGVVGSMSLEGFSFVDALYYTTVTVATVGYGDIHPVTPAGKVLAVVMIMVGVGAFLAVIANVTEFLLVKREGQLRAERAHMMVGLFMSEVGNKLLRLFAPADPDGKELEGLLKVDPKWSDADFERVSLGLQGHKHALDASLLPFDRIRDLLRRQSNFLLQFLENPNLEARDAFADLLRAAFHLREELINRRALDELPRADREHLERDARRVYLLLVREWLRHLGYLRGPYPYLFSLAVRNNPFDKAASVVIQSSCKDPDRKLLSTDPVRMEESARPSSMRLSRVAWRVKRDLRIRPADS
jgi:hypothetical protein